MIQPLKETLDISLKEISQYQQGKIKQVKTNREWLDNQGGILPQSILLICGASFGGKTTELDNLRSDIMNTSINEDASNYVWLSNSFEMTSIQTTLRDLRKMFKKSFKELLKDKFSEEEQEKLLTYYSNKTDGRFFVNNDSSNAEKLLYDIEQFVASNKDKRMVFVDIDHAALIMSDNAGKKMAIDDFVEGINKIKKEYSNVIFIILTQLNRGILSRIEPKSNNMAIQRGDIYQSDTMFHISDYIYGLQNPYYFKIEEYRLISPSKYNHLSHRFTPPNKNGKVSLYSEGCIFVEVLKDRTADFDFTDLYTIEIRDFEKKESIVNTTPMFDEGSPF